MCRPFLLNRPQAAQCVFLRTGLSDLSMPSCGLSELSMPSCDERKKKPGAGKGFADSTLSERAILHSSL